MYEYKCRIVKVIDGDTVDVDIDLGFGVWLRKQRVRLVGIDTPESRTKDLEEKKYGLAAKEFLTKCVTSGGLTIKTTKDLSELVLSAVSRQSKKHPATNIFRAIRMKINQELDELYKVLEASSYALCFGGRLAVISFHSIEDRVVKRFIQGKDRKESPIKFSYTGPKFIKASSEEIKINPRSRSAILRVAEKVM